jgi:sigma-B regulation protein RsbU (phosphoserine phosphatase)
VTAELDPAVVEDRLRAIQSITDAALSRLDDHELLTELLERTRDALQADTAAVLLLDFASGQLIATAAAGLEEEVHQGVRIPVGRGFAGRIAAGHQPVILDHVDHTTVLNPILWAKGIQSMMGVPMVAGGKVIGVLHVGSLTRRQFTAHEVELLQLAADRAAAAVQSMTIHADRLAATALQRSLMPTALPVVAGAEMAARYIPGSGGVGGDWYDVFTLPTGELCVVIGDVAGSGLPAAVIMGRMRSALRAYALETRDPAEVLSRLDRKMQYFEADAMATVLYAVIDPGLDRMDICLAGHFPPVIAYPGQPAELASVPVGLIIGIADQAPRPVTSLAIPPGALLCFYTDGLIERRGEVIDAGLARLCRSVTAEPPEDACATVMHALVGSAPARDDIALLMVRRQAGHVDNRRLAADARRRLFGRGDQGRAGGGHPGGHRHQQRRRAAGRTAGVGRVRARAARGRHDPDAVLRHGRVARTGGRA